MSYEPPAISPTIVDAKGDLVGASADNTPARVGPVGTNGTALVADSTATPGVAWSTTINGTAIPSSKTLVVTTDKLSVHAATTSAELAGVISDETGSGALVFGTSPTLTTPALGVATATSVNGTTIPTSKTLVVTTDKLSVHAATTSAELAGVISDETGSGALVFGTTPTIATPALTLSTTTSNTEGRIAWDATNDQISVGDGAAQAVFGKLGSTNGAALGTAAAGTATTAAHSDHVHPTTGVVPTTRTITATAPITIAGTTSADLSADRTIAITAASTAAAGAVQLSDSTSTTSSTLAATATAVKSAYDLAAAAVPKSTVTTAGDLIVATGSAAVTRLGAGASGAALVSTGTTTAPAYSTTINGTAIPATKTLVVTTDKLSVHAATSSSELAGVISDETGSGALVFATTPTLTTPVITQATATPTFASNTYTLASGDEGKMLLASNSTTAGNVKIPTNATTAFAIGTQIHVIQTGTGQLTISATTSGTTSVLSAGGTAASPKLRAQYSAATMLKTATDTWYVFGDIS